MQVTDMIGSGAEHEAVVARLRALQASRAAVVPVAVPKPMILRLARGATRAAERVVRRQARERFRVYRLYDTLRSKMLAAPAHHSKKPRTAAAIDDADANLAINPRRACGGGSIRSRLCPGSAC
jgi:hypothetical protein